MFNAKTHSFNLNANRNMASELIHAMQKTGVPPVVEATKPTGSAEIDTLFRAASKTIGFLANPDNLKKKTVKRLIEATEAAVAEVEMKIVEERNVEFLVQLDNLKKTAEKQIKQLKKRAEAEATAIAKASKGKTDSPKVEDEKVSVEPMTVDGVEISEDDIQFIRNGRKVTAIMDELIDFTGRRIDTCTADDVVKFFEPLFEDFNKLQATGSENLQIGQQLLPYFVGVLSNTGEQQEDIFQTLKDLVINHFKIGVEVISEKQAPRGKKK